MAFITKEKLFSREWFRAYSLITLGTLILASGFVFFISPYKLAPGGTYGVAIILHHLLDTPIGLTALAIDIPLAIIGYKILGPRFGVKTVVGFLLTAFWVDFLNYFWEGRQLVENEGLLTAIFGGVLLGAGLGLIFKSKATSGGSDIIAMVLNRYTGQSLGHLLIYIDSAIVLGGLLAFQDWKIPLFSWITIFVTGKVIDIILEGVSYEKTLFIVSDHANEIRDKIINDLQRGGTFIRGEGMYQGKDKTIIFTVVNRRELTILQDYIYQIDSNAFLTVINANEILGGGFKPLSKKIEETSDFKS
ncbi:MAG: YitT family protein [Bacteroidales bacterium]|nr:YitT family protein [Bacteroidales bacterium]MCF8326883.1 YitT family protein [Bacteroidales bacterium]